MLLLQQLWVRPAPGNEPRGASAAGLSYTPLAPGHLRSNDGVGWQGHTMDGDGMAAMRALLRQHEADLPQRPVTDPALPPLRLVPRSQLMGSVPSHPPLALSKLLDPVGSSQCLQVRGHCLAQTRPHHHQSWRPGGNWELWEVRREGSAAFVDVADQGELLTWLSRLWDTQQDPRAGPRAPGKVRASCLPCALRSATTQLLSPALLMCAEVKPLSVLRPLASA